MSNAEVAAQVLEIQVLYPRVWFACHAEHSDASAKKNGLSERESTLLAHLLAGMSSPDDLGRHLGKSASTLSETVDGLVARGLVERKRREDDRRRVDLDVTDRGRETYSRGSALSADRLAAALERLSVSDRAAVVRGLSLLARACAEGVR
jgi:DNA-binding MarR family transcriptional regulator